MLNFAVRSQTGLECWNVDTKDGVPQTKHFKPFFKETKPARAICYSENFFAAANASDTRVFNSENMELKFTVPRTKAYMMKFSPQEKYFVVYEIYTSSKENAENPNLFIYETATGNEKISFVMKRHSDWEPHFASDESFFAIMVNGDVSFYENFVKTDRKLTGKVGGFSVSPGATPHVALYLRGVKGSPSMCRLFTYPNMETNPISSKSFSQADKVEMIWNKKGTGCLILTSMDVDSTGVSYYGKQALHFLAVSGDSYSVPLSADGPIHAVSWSPKSNQFIVVYGNNPAKATLFNLKCDSVFDFGTGIRNSIYFNDFGNLVLFGAFGNLRGQIEIWDLNKKKQVSTGCAADTTLLSWDPSGNFFLTATTAPRLRQGNGFKIYHYSGALLFELMWPEKQELYELQWRKYPAGVFKENIISYEKVTGIQSVQKQASEKKYVPPNIRAFGEDTSSPNAPPAQGPIPGLPPGYTSSKVQNAQKSRGKKPQGQNPAKPQGPNPSKPQNQNKSQTQPQKPSPQLDNIKSTTVNIDANGGATDKDNERRKKASAIKKKLKDIKLLKEKQANGDKLDKHQLAKISSEAELTKELSALAIS